MDKKDRRSRARPDRMTFRDPKEQEFQHWRIERIEVELVNRIKTMSLKRNVPIRVIISEAMDSLEKK